MNERNIPDTAALDALRERLGAVRELLLANVVMFGEISAPTFGESARARFMLDRFIEAGCQSVSTDEVGNAVAIYPGRVGAGNILVSAHLDTVFPASVDHTVHVRPASMTGAGIMDNSLGVAAVASLPLLLEAAGIELEDNLILLGTSRSHGRGNIEGMRFFLNHNVLPVKAALLCEGGTLGRLSYESLGMLRGVLEVKLPPLPDNGFDDEDEEPAPLASASEKAVANADGSHEDAWRLQHGGGCGTEGCAISILNRLVSGILALEIPRDPPTQIIIGSIEAGTSFNTRARTGTLRFELRSEGERVVGQIGRQIDQVVRSVAQDCNCAYRLRWDAGSGGGSASAAPAAAPAAPAETSAGCEIGLHVVAQRRRYHQSPDHPYVSACRALHEALGVSVHSAPSTGEIEALLAKHIPALTIGLTRGYGRHERDETIEIDPIFTGLTQVLALLQAIDGGRDHG